MLTREQIEKLQAFDAYGAHVLSAYLDLDPASQVRRSYLIAFDDLVKAASVKVDASARTDFATDTGAMRSWLESQEVRGKGFVAFSCAARGFWHAEFLAVRIANHLVFEPRPDVAPLLRLMDEYERYAVALVDKRTARLFSVFLGEIEEREEFKDLVISKHDQGGWSQANYQRHHETHVYWHLKRVAQRLAELHRRRRFDRLILAGPTETTSALHRVLPRALAHRVVATVPMQHVANDRDILEKTLEVERRIEREAEERLVAELIDRAGPAGQAILGVRSTLAALWSDLVQTLVVAHSIGGEGSECPNCLRLEPGRVETCPTCGSTTHPVHDLFHRAMERAVDQHGRVEVVLGDAEKRLTKVGGGLGALLRYPSPVPRAVSSSAARN